MKDKINQNLFKTLIGLVLFLTVANAIAITSFHNHKELHFDLRLYATDRKLTASSPSKVVETVTASELYIPQTEAEWTRLLLEKKALAAGLNESDVKLLTRIGVCESGLRNVPNKSGVSSAIGAFQELAMHDNKGNRYVTEGNIDIAIKLYNHGQGLSHWASSKFCWGSN